MSVSPRYSAHSPSPTHSKLDHFELLRAESPISKDGDDIGVWAAMRHPHTPPEDMPRPMFSALQKGRMQNVELKKSVEFANKVAVSDVTSEHDFDDTDILQPKQIPPFHEFDTSRRYDVSSRRGSNSSSTSGGQPPGRERRMSSSSVTSRRGLRIGATLISTEVPDDDDNLNLEEIASAALNPDALFRDLDSTIRPIYNTEERWRISKVCMGLSSNKWFQRFMVCLIAANCIGLILMDPTIRSKKLSYTMGSNGNPMPKKQIALQTLDFVCLIAVTLELIINCIAEGYRKVGNSTLYFSRNRYNVVDGLLILFVWFLFLDPSPSQNLRHGLLAFKTFRLYNNYIYKLPFLQASNAILHSIRLSLPLIFDSFVLLMFFMLLFGGVGVQLFQKSLGRRCLMNELDENGNVTYVEMTPEMSLYCSSNYSDEGSWIFAGRMCEQGQLCMPGLMTQKNDLFDFDTLPVAAITMSNLLTLNDWSSVYSALGSGSNVMVAVFWFVPFILLVAILLINLFVSVIVANFSTVRVAQRLQRLQIAKLTRAIHVEEQKIFEIQGEMDEVSTDFADQSVSDHKRFYLKNRLQELEDEMLSVKSRIISLESDLTNIGGKAGKSTAYAAALDTLNKMNKENQLKTETQTNSEEAMQLIREVPIFKEAANDPSFVSEIVKRLRPLHVEPNVSIIKAGELGDDMYFIKNGDCNVITVKDGVEKKIFTLSTGGFFGEIALLYEGKRTATIRSARECALLVFSKSDFSEVVQMFPEAFKSIKEAANERIIQLKQREMQELVERVPMFATVIKDHPNFAADIVSRLQAVELNPDSAVVTKGDLGDSMYFIAEGSCKVMVGDKVVATLGKYQFFGEIALLHSAPRTATIVTAEACTLMELSKGEFRKITSKYNGSLQAVEEAAGDRLEQLKIQFSSSNELEGVLPKQKKLEWGRQLYMSFTRKQLPRVRCCLMLAQAALEVVQNFNPAKVKSAATQIYHLEIVFLWISCAFFVMSLFKDTATLVRGRSRSVVSSNFDTVLRNSGSKGFAILEIVHYAVGFISAHILDGRNVWLFLSFPILFRYMLKFKTGWLALLSKMILSSLNGLVYFYNMLILLLFVCFVFGVAGIQLFGGMWKEGDPPVSTRENCDTLGSCMYTQFWVTTGDDWIIAVQRGVDTDGYFHGIVAPIFFTAVYIIGNFVYVALLVAFVMENYELSAAEREMVMEKVKKRFGDGEEPDETIRLLNKILDVREEIKKTVPNTLVIHLTRLLSKIGFKQRLSYSLFIFSPTNRLRITACRLVRDDQFKRLVTLCVIVSSISLALEKPPSAWRNERSSKDIQNLIIDFITTGIFFIEAATKIVSWGFFIYSDETDNYAPEPYTHSFWNVADFIQFILQVLGLLFPEQIVFNLGRVLRPVRLMHHVSDVRIMIQSLVGASGTIGALLLQFVYMIMFFSVACVSFYSGKLNTCSDGVAYRAEDCVGTFTDDTGMLFQKQWAPPESNFETLPAAMLTMFEIAGLSGWNPITQPPMDMRSDGLPQPLANPLSCWFILIITCFCSLYVVSTFICVVISRVNAERGFDLLNNQQLVWEALKRQFKNLHVQPRIVLPGSRLRRWCFIIAFYPQHKLYIHNGHESSSGVYQGDTINKDADHVSMGESEGKDWTSAAGSDNAILRELENVAAQDSRVTQLRGSQTAFNLSVTAGRTEPTGRQYKHFGTATRLDHVMILVNLLNTVVICLVHAEMSPSWNATLFALHTVTVFFFAFEMIVKVVAVGPTRYLRTLWNRFECSATLVSLVGIGLKNVVPMMWPLAACVHSLRIVRFLASLKYLFITLIVSGPELLRLLMFCVLVVHVYGLAGKSLFGHLRFGESLNPNANFRKFHRIYVLVFKLITLDDWNGLMRDSSHVASGQECSDDSELFDCGSPAAPVYFLLFFVLGNLILFNLFIAVVLPYFNNRYDEGIVTQRDLQHFIAVWQEFDPEGTGHIRRFAFPRLVSVLNEEFNILGNKVHPVQNGMRFRALLLMMELYLLEQTLVRRSQSWEARKQRIISLLMCRTHEEITMPDVVRLMENNSGFIEVSAALILLGRTLLGWPALTFSEQRDLNHRKETLQYLLANKVLAGFMRRFKCVQYLEKRMPESQTRILLKMRQRITRIKARNWVKQYGQIRQDSQRYIKSHLLEQAQKLIQAAEQNMTNYTEELQHYFNNSVQALKAPPPNVFALAFNTPPARVAS